MEYTWIDGKFHLRQKGSLRWQHLNEFPIYSEMDRVMSNERMVNLALDTGEAVRVSYEPLISQGWCLHQMWLDSPSFNLVPSGVA